MNIHARGGYDLRKSRFTALLRCAQLASRCAASAHRTPTVNSQLDPLWGPPRPARCRSAHSRSAAHLALGCTCRKVGRHAEVRASSERHAQGSEGLQIPTNFIVHPPQTLEFLAIGLVG